MTTLASAIDCMDIERYGNIAPALRALYTALTGGELKIGTTLASAQAVQRTLDQFIENLALPVKFVEDEDGASYLVVDLDALESE